MPGLFWLHPAAGHLGLLQPRAPPKVIGVRRASERTWPGLLTTVREGVEGLEPYMAKKQPP